MTDRRTAAPAAAGPAGPAEDKDGVWHTVDARFTTKDGNAIYTVIMALNNHKWDGIAIVQLNKEMILNKHHNPIYSC